MTDFNQQLTATPSLDKLRWIMAQLRDPNQGCPWDLKQTFQSIVAHTLEEAYEVVDAVEQEDFIELKKELGDLLFQVIFYSHLAQEQKLFDLDDVIGAICEKLIRRHPHVFNNKLLTNDLEIKANWENEKIKERQLKAQLIDQNAPVSILADIPKSLPALSQANKIQKRCSHIGFDWNNINDVFDKIVEEVDEVKAELQPENKQDINQQALGEELGDLLFAVVNLCRHSKQDPETLLRQANKKFIKRFHGVEQQVKQSGKDFSEHNITQLEQYWQHVKASEKCKSI